MPDAEPVAHPVAEPVAEPHAAFDALVAGLYSAAAGEQAWSQPLAAFQALFGAWGVHLHGIDAGQGNVSFSYEVGGFPPEGALAYIRHYHRIDPRSAMVAQLAPGQWKSCHQLFDDEFVARDPFYQEFLLPYGGRWVSGSKIYQDAEVIAFFGIHRGRGMQPLDDAELALGQRLGRHLSQALGLWRRQGRQQARHLLGAAVLEHLPHPVLLLDEQLQLQHANPAARSRLQDDPRLRIDGGRLAFGRPAAQQELVSALRTLRIGGADAYRHDSPERSRATVRVDDGSSRAPLALFVTPLRPAQTMGAFGARPLAMVVVHDVGRPAEVDAFVAAAIFDFTPAEAAVAVGVARGRTLAELAADHGVAPSTVRAQLNAVFGKMGVNRQAEVAGALAALPAWG